MDRVVSRRQRKRLAARLGRLARAKLAASYDQFERTGALSDLDKVIEDFQEAVSLTHDGHPDKPTFFNHLGISLETRFQRTWMPNDLEEAIRSEQQAIELTPDGHPDRPIYFNDLGRFLQSRFECTGMRGDLEEAFQNLQRAVSLTPDDHPSKPIYLNNLGNSLESRFERTGMLGDLEEAIQNKRQAIALTPDGHPNKPMYFNNLGNSLQSRFRRTGTLGDLEEAIQNQRQAVSLTPDGHPSKPALFSNLGTSLHSRFERTGMLNDLEEATQVRQQAVSLAPDGHPYKPTYFNNLGISLQSRFERTGMQSDLEAAIQNRRQAVSLTPDGHPKKPMFLNNLGNSLQYRFECARTLGDLEEAIQNQQQAFSLIPDGHPDKPTYFYNLGLSFESRFDHTGSLTDLAEAISNYRSAATSNIGPILQRCHASKYWARLETKRDPPSALLAYRHAINLLPQLAWIGDPIATRHSQLTALDDLSREAAAFALDAGHPDLALEWLEQGRSVVWNQLVCLRTSVELLYQTHPDICAKFTQVSRELQSAATRGYTINASDTNVRDPISVEQETQHHHRLAATWDSLVEEIRLLPNFQDFLLPRKVSALKEAAISGPLVVINVHQRRCDALILKSDADHVLHIPLHQLSHQDVIKMREILNEALAGHGYRGAGIKLGSSHLSKILSKLYLHVVDPILKSLGFITSTGFDPLSLPRIWWCPTGPLTFLPLHAACRGIGTRINGTFTHAVSSYTPTVNALLEARLAKRQPFSQLVGIAMTHTPDYSPLPAAETEIANIAKFFSSDSGRRFEILRNEQATGEQVLTHMTKSSWIHLACHGVQDEKEPTRSGFCLHDRRLTIMDIIAKPFVQADFAFLSACETATGDTKVSDEAVHITSAMLGAGYRSVIGTMWAISDEVAPSIATKVYSVLLSGGEPDSDRAAHALHQALREVRESDHDSFHYWVPFVHYGA